MLLIHAAIVIDENHLTSVKYVNTFEIPMKQLDC